MASSAVSEELISTVVGYKIKKGTPETVTQNLPQRIAILCEVNEDFQSSVNFDEGVEITSAQQAGTLFGYGSPAHSIMRILRPVSGSGVAGIPTIVYPQEKASGATSRILDIAPSGVADKNATHTVIVNGRTTLDGASYNFTVNTGDTAAEITQKIEDAINGVEGCSFTASNDSYSVTAETKWKGLTAQEANIEIDTNGVDAGITYTVNEDQAGAGTPSVGSALANFGENWNTVVINSYGFETTTLDLLEDFNGIPDPENPTGRFASTIMRPFFAFTGFVTSTISTITAITDARKDEVTIVPCPAPGSNGFSFEAAANAALLYAPLAQNNPQLDLQNKSYVDMPTPATIGTMADYLNRDSYVLKGTSTCALEGGKYVIKDFVTTYHPVGENPPQFRYVRSLTIDLNIYFRYKILEGLNVMNKAIASNNSIVSATNVIKPIQWKQLLISFADQLALDALITDVSFMKDSIVVDISDVNPDRLSTEFSYKRTGFSRISSTDAEANFNFKA